MSTAATVRQQEADGPLAEWITFTVYRAPGTRRIVSVAAACKCGDWKAEAVTAAITRELASTHAGTAHGVVVKVDYGPAARRLPGRTSAAFPLDEAEMRRAEWEGPQAVADLLARRNAARGQGPLGRHVTLRR